MLVIVVFFIVFRWIHLSTPLLRLFLLVLILLLFFFSSRRPHTIWTGDWSSDVCSSDLDVFYDEFDRRRSGGADRTRRRTRLCGRAPASAKGARARPDLPSDRAAARGRSARAD